MREDIAGPQGASSRPMWETLEGMVREKAQEFIQQIMEEEVTELLGREKSERRSDLPPRAGSIPNPPLRLPRHMERQESVHFLMLHELVLDALTL